MKLPQTHSLTERCEEGRCQATRLFRAGLQDIFKLLRMRHKERILFPHRSDFLFDLGNQPFLGLAPTETVAKFLAEQGYEYSIVRWEEDSGSITDFSGGAGRCV